MTDGDLVLFQYKDGTVKYDSDPRVGRTFKINPVTKEFEIFERRLYEWRVWYEEV